MSAVLFDAMGTLFELSPLRERLGDSAVEAWSQRILHSAATLTLTGLSRPFDELAERAFATTAAKLGSTRRPARHWSCSAAARR